MTDDTVVLVGVGNDGERRQAKEDDGRGRLCLAARLHQRDEHRARLVVSSRVLTTVHSNDGRRDEHNRDEHDARLACHVPSSYVGGDVVVRRDEHSARLISSRPPVVVVVRPSCRWRPHRSFCPSPKVYPWANRPTRAPALLSCASWIVG